MSSSVRVVYDAKAEIEERLAQALGEPAPEATSMPERLDHAEVTSRELLQMAWDKAEQEIDSLNGELRRLRKRYQDEERTLLNQINRKKRLQRELLDRVPESAAR